MDAIVTEGLYFPTTVTVEGPPIVDAENTSIPEIPPPRITEIEDTSSP